eukprot:g3347.t1
MVFGLFSRRQKPAPTADKLTASGFLILLRKTKRHADPIFGDVPNEAAVPFTLYAVVLAAKVLINVFIALQTLIPSETLSQTEAIQRHFSQRFSNKRSKSVRSRPILFRKRRTRNIADDDASSCSSVSFTFHSLRSETTLTALESKTSTLSELLGVSQMETKDSSFSYDETPHEEPLASTVHVSSSSGSSDIGYGVIEELEPSCFEIIARGLSLPEITEEDCGALYDEQLTTESNSPSTLEESNTSAVTQTNTEEVTEMRCVSPCSSLRSTFSDSVAVKFANSNFANPHHLEDSHELIPRRGKIGGSIRHLYTMRRLQSLLSRRSTFSPSMNGRNTPSAPDRRLSMHSRRSLANSYSKRQSFNSRGRSSGRLLESYSVIRLESCIRKAWRLSRADECVGHPLSNEHDTSSVQSELQRQRSRNSEVKFLRVQADHSTGFLVDQKHAVLNPHFGDDASLRNEEDDISSDDGETLKAKSVVLRTPLQNYAPIDENYVRCARNFDEGCYDNPLEVCSLRSYDSDTELELTSFKYRNPISKLLELDRVRGVSKDGIPLAELEGNTYGSTMLKEAEKCPVRDRILDKYLTQIVINDAMEHPKEKTGNELDVKDSVACREQLVSQELDSGLRCLLLERFLLDNVIYEMDVNLEAMELARVQQERTRASSRILRRS